MWQGLHILRAINYKDMTAINLRKKEPKALRLITSADTQPVGGLMWTCLIRNFPSLVLSYSRLQFFLQPRPPPLKMCLHHVCTYSLALSYRKCPFFARKLPYNGDQPGQRGPIWRRLGRFRTMFAVLRNEMIYHKIFL